MNKFVISGFSDEIDQNFDVQLQEVKRLEIAYIEIRGVNGRSIADHSLEEVKSLKDKLNAAGIKVSAIGSPIGKINIKDSFEPHFERFKHVVEIANLLETNYIRLFSFFMEPSEIATYREEVMRRMKAMVDYIEGTDIILLHENEKDIYGDTPERCLEIIRRINSQHLKMIFDPANYIQCGVEAYPAAFQMVKEHVVYLHIKDALKESGVVVPAGQGDGRLKEMFTELTQMSFSGFLSLEPHLGSFEGFSQLEKSADPMSFKEKSDAEKFALAAQCLRTILTNIENA